MRDLVLGELLGGLWHTTPPDRFKRILELGAILPIQPETAPRVAFWEISLGQIVKLAVSR